MNGRFRVRTAFDEARRARRTALIPYFVAGYPSWAKCREHLWEASDAGADLVELGIPFSDPVADGPTIQHAINQALARGVTVAKTLEFLRDLRRDGLVLPVLGMTYANLLYAPGFERSARSWGRAGFDGAIIPDLPVEEASGFRSALQKQDLATVFLASPTTAPNRLRRILRASTGFAYLVAVYGTTGARKGLAPETVPLLRRARRARNGSRPPLCVGFGVSSPDHVAVLRTAGADGVIVGSALVSRLDRGESPKAYLRSLARATGSR